MSDYNGFSFDLEGNGKKITKDRVKKVLEFTDGSNEWNIIEEVLEVEDGNIILMENNFLRVYALVPGSQCMHC